jgi:hypothetical protein
MEQATENKSEIRHNPAESQETPAQKEERDDQLRTKTKKALFLDFFAKTMGIVDAAAKGAEIHRDTVYDWRKKDQTFALAMDQIVSAEPDIAEQQLKMAILKGYMPSVHFYLSRRHPAYKQKIEHSGVVLNIYAQLTDEQKLERLGRIIAARGGRDGQAKLDLLNGGDPALPENGEHPQGGGAEAKGSGNEPQQKGDLPASSGPLENNGNNDQLRDPAPPTEPGHEGPDNQREAG